MQFNICLQIQVYNKVVFQPKKHSSFLGLGMKGELLALPINMKLGLKFLRGTAVTPGCFAIYFLLAITRLQESGLSAKNTLAY
jgi:hypothetical protein